MANENISYAHGQAERFLAALDPRPEAKFNFRTFDDKQSGQTPARLYDGKLSNVREKLTRVQENGAGVYVTVNETDGGGVTANNVTRVRAVFLDLDGSPLSPVVNGEWLKPHITVESSPGRYHAYWLVDNFPLDGFRAVQKALAAKFDGDTSIHDLPRVMRLPGFLHKKREDFQTRIINLHSHERYTYFDFLEAFTEEEFAAAAKPKRDDVVPAAGSFEDMAAPTSVEEVREALSYIDPDCEYSDWISVLAAIHHTFGWDGIELAETWSSASSKHKDGDVERRFRSFDSTPTTGITKSTLFRLAEQNGADLAVISRNALMRELTAQHGAIDVSDFVYIAEGSGIFRHISQRTDMTKSSIDLMYKHIHQGGRNDPLAGTILTNHPDLLRCTKKSWFPAPYGKSEGLTFQHGGTDYFNTWAGFGVTPAEGDVRPWLALTKHLIPDDEERKHFIDRLAFDVQHPDDKCEWSAVLIGIEGAGKNQVLAPLAKIFGPAYGDVSNDEIKSVYDDGFAERKIIVVNEIQNLYGSTMEKIKQRTTTQGDGMMLLNIKSKGQIYHPAIWSMYFTTNNRDAMNVSESERRFFVLYAKTKMIEMPDNGHDKYHAWLKNGGSAALMDFLLKRDLSAFRKGELPMRTEAFEDMVESSKRPYQDQIEELVNSQDADSGIKRGLVNAATLAGALSDKTRSRVSPAMVRAELEKYGWMKIKEIHTAQKGINGKLFRKSRAYMAPSDSDLHGLWNMDLYNAIDAIEKESDFLE